MADGDGGKRTGRFAVSAGALRFLLAALLFIAIDVFDSFGLDQAADEQAERVLGTATAAFYGGATRVGQKAITVVLIDDATLERRRWDTPLDYAAQADIIEAIAGHEPTAIFLDLHYTRPHGVNPAHEIKVFQERVSASASAAGARVLIGPVSRDSPELAPLRSFEQVGVSWRSASWWDYPMQARTGEAMAAPALYGIWCAKSQSCKDGWRPDPSDELLVSWGYGASPAASAFHDEAWVEACVLPDNRWTTRALAAVSAFTRSLGRAMFYDSDRGDPVESRCAYADTLTAGAVLDGDFNALGPLLKDRIVLVGAAYSDTADRHLIPHVGVVPGVMIHAMALDNLITDGTAFTRPPPRLFLALDAADAIELGLTGLLLLIVWLLRVRALTSYAQSSGVANIAEGRNLRAQLRKSAALALVVMCLALCAVAVAIQNILHWPAPNVFAVVGLVVTAVLLFDEKFGELLYGQD